jgi:hypothetical protein
MEGKRVIAKRAQVLTVVTTLQNNLTIRRAICCLKTLVSLKPPMLSEDSWRPGREHSKPVSHPADPNVAAHVWNRREKHISYEKQRCYPNTTSNS